MRVGCPRAKEAQGDGNATILGEFETQIRDATTLGHRRTGRRVGERVCPRLDEFARTASRRGSGQKDQSTPNKSSTMISESGTPRSQRMMGIVAVPVSVCVAKQTTKQAMRSRLS